MTETSSSSSVYRRFPFRKKRPASASTKSNESNKNISKKISHSNLESNAEDLLEPFQELVDEINWDTLDGSSFPMQDVSVDKPIASEAVAFVIRASRRGVVPLCAEVANLLKENSRLEETVNEQSTRLEHLTEEIEFLRDKVSGPRPTTRECGLQTIQESDCQTMTVEDSFAQTDMIRISCIRKEDIQLLKFNISTEELRSGRYREDHDLEPCRMKFGGVTSSCGGDVILTCSCSHLASSSTQNPVTISIGVNTVSEDCMDSTLGYFEHMSLEKCHRDLKQEHENLTSKYEDIGKIKEEFGVELKSAKGEIVALQKTIQDFQNKEYEKELEEDMLRRHENYSVDVQDTNESLGEWDCTIQRVVNSALGPKRGKSLLPILTPKGGKRSTSYPGPIVGCKCQMCTAFFRSSGLLGFACSPYITDVVGKNPVLRDLKKLVWLQNSKLQIKPNDQVMTRSNRVGTVRYVGHLDGVGNQSVVYVGLELEYQDGRHDGYHNGKRYFVCRHKHGIFIPLEDVLCILDGKLQTRTSVNDVHSASSLVKRNKSTGLASAKKLTSHRSGASYISAAFSTSSSASATGSVISRTSSSYRTDQS